MMRRLFDRALFPCVIHVVFSCQQNLGNGNDSIAVLLEKLQNGRESLRGVERCVVEETDGAGLNLFCYTLCDFSRGEVFPVETVTTVHPVQTLQRKGFILSDTPQNQGSPEYD